MSVKKDDKAFDELVTEVSVACLRKTGTFGLVRAPSSATAPYVLVAGHHRATECPGGYIVSLGISKEQLMVLRDLCNTFLNGDA
jgi:hypothetical protein